MEEPGPPLGVPAPVLQPPPEVADLSRDRPGPRRCVVGERADAKAFDPRPQVGVHPLVRIEREDPVVRRRFDGAVLLRHPAGPVGLDHACTRAKADRHRVVPTPGVEDQDLVAERHALEARGDAIRLVLGDDASRDRHGIAGGSAVVDHHGSGVYPLPSPLAYPARPSHPDPRGDSLSAWPSTVSPSSSVSAP